MGESCPRSCEYPRCNFGCQFLKSVSIRKPGGTRQEVIMLKSPIWLKLGTNDRYHKVIYRTKYQVKISNSLGDMGPPLEKLQFSLFYA